MDTIVLSKFGQTRQVKVRMFLNNKEIEAAGKYDEVLWVERNEDWYALQSPQLRQKLVAVVTRDDWLSADIIKEE